MKLAKYMRADTQLPTEGTLNLSSLVETWINSNLETDHIIKIPTNYQAEAYFVLGHC